jgi:hypothetical protein
MMAREGSVWHFLTSAGLAIYSPFNAQKEKKARVTLA